MNGDAQPLRAAILEDPADRDQWGVYADWLEEYGHPAAESTRQFADALGDDGLIVRCIHLNAAALQGEDHGHTAFCAQTATLLARGEISDLLNNESFDLLETEEFTSASAETNASMFSVDEVEVLGLSWTEDGCEARCSYSASGEQDEDRWFYGDTVRGGATAIVTADGRVSFTNVTADVHHPADDERLDPDGYPEAE